jgi:DNA-binding IclR family transcriptional regulator
MAEEYSNATEPTRRPAATHRGVERIVKALDFVAGRGWVSAAELSAALDVDRSTGWRLAQSLQRVGWLHLDADSHQYRLGVPLFELGVRVLETFDVRAEARRVMTELVASTGESADLAILDGDSAVFIDKIDGTHEVRAFTRSGQRAKLHTVAAGKIFLAYMPERDLEAYLAGSLEPYTPLTITDASVLRRVVEETRGRGWAVNRGELHEEAGALAVPIIDAGGVCVAALGLNIPLTRLRDEDMQVLIAALEDAAGRITPTTEFGGSSRPVYRRP